jgi:hypothetical protein
MRTNDESAASGQPIPTGKRGQRDRLRQRDWLRERDGLRCELDPVKPSKYRSFNRLKPAAPPLVLDIQTNGAIRLTDPDTKALVASTWLAEVTATPAEYRCRAENSPSYTQPLLLVDVPGLQPLRIGARPMGSGNGGPNFRYDWRGSVHAPNWILDWILSLVSWLRGSSRIRGAKEPAYVVTEAEWLTLVEKFGLGSRVVDEHASGKIERRNRRKKIMFYAELALILIVLAVAAYMQYAR